MQPLEPARLGTERLLLRPLAPHDEDALSAVFSDPEVMRYWSSLPWTDREQAGQYVTAAAAGLENGTMLRLGIEIAATGQLIGQAALYSFDSQNRHCHIGYALGRPHWGKGYAIEALTALLAYGFAALDLNRVEAEIDPSNDASARALERLGFQREGLMRERSIVGGAICDTAFYGLLKREWDGRNSR